MTTTVRDLTNTRLTSLEADASVLEAARRMRDRQSALGDISSAPPNR